MIKRILVIGAFDRYNYGDLLFPYIIEHQLKKMLGETSFDFFGIIESDLSAIGGKKTHDIVSFYNNCNNSNSQVSVIIAGGEALSVTWDSLYSSLSKLGVLLKKVKWQFGISEELINLIAKKMLKGKTLLPFTFNKLDFDGVENVIYNALGGTSVGKLNLHFKNELINKVDKIDYFSVRDVVTHNALSSLNIRTELIPDSAILLSEIFSINSLSIKVRAEIKDFVAQNKGNYLFFQVNNKLANSYKEEISTSLYEIGKHTSICFCPIGTALGHSDQKGLKKIKLMLDFSVKMFEDVSIWDIMYLIANAKIYMGTSLHGVITSMSYQVPYVGLEVEKLNSYLKTWGIKGLDKAIRFNEMPIYFGSAMEIDKEQFEKSFLHQAKKAKESFFEIAKTISPMLGK